MSFNKPIYRLIVFIVVTAAALAGFYAYDQREMREQPDPASVTQEEHSTISVTIGDSYTNEEFTAPADATILDVLKLIGESDPALKLQTEEYSGMGTLVTGMYGRTNGTDDQYWQYRVNGETPLISADALEVHSGDTIEWHFSPSSF